MNKVWLKRIALFVFMIAVMFGLTVFKDQNRNDRASKKFALQEGKTITTTVDLGKQGSLKMLLNPNIYTIYGRVEPGTNAKLRCEGSSDNMSMMLSQGTKKGIWDVLQPNETLKKRRNSTTLNVELYVPKEALQNKDVAQGELKFYDGDKLYSTVIVKVVNSAAK